MALVKKHLELDDELIEKIEADAKAAKVSISEVIRARLQASYASESQAQTRIEIALEQLRADTQKLLASFEAVNSPQASPDPVPAPEKIATYDEMYGRSSEWSDPSPLKGEGNTEPRERRRWWSTPRG
jgi:hypothetical protein